MSLGFALDAASNESHYTVHSLGACRYIRGKVPLSDLANLLQAASTDSVLAPDMAWLLDAQLAYGPREAVREHVQALRAERLAWLDSGGVRPGTEDLSESLRRWIELGQHGASSAAIVRRLTGYAHPKFAQGRGWDHPHDPDDFVRCLKLLREVPELSPRIGEMASCSKAWASVCAHWAELESLLRSEASAWLEGGEDVRDVRSQEASAPQTYARMREILDGKQRSR